MCSQSIKTETVITKTEKNECNFKIVPLTSNMYSRKFSIGQNMSETDCDKM